MSQSRASRREREHRERQRVDDRSKSRVDGGVRDNHGEYLEASELRVNKFSEMVKFSAGWDVYLPPKRNVSEW